MRKRGKRWESGLDWVEGGVIGWEEEEEEAWGRFESWQLGWGEDLPCCCTPAPITQQAAAGVCRLTEQARRWTSYSAATDGPRWISRRSGGVRRGVPRTWLEPGWEIVKDGGRKGNPGWKTGDG